MTLALRQRNDTREKVLHPFMFPRASQAQFSPSHRFSSQHCRTTEANTTQLRKVAVCPCIHTKAAGLR